MSIKEAKQIVRSYGLKLIHDIEWQEFIVYQTSKHEPMSYHTDDLEDAVDTAKNIHEQ
jgi:hypothetical protein